MRKVAIFTGTRAEYGLLYWLMQDINSDRELDLAVLVSGMHLSPEFGLTWTDIEADGIEINEKVEMLLSSNTAVGTAKSIGLGIVGMADALKRIGPDLLVILGDRFEALAAAQTAMILRVPILHIHGGELTSGAYDDCIRHAITKLSHLHCTSAEKHRERVIQLGESPDRVFNVGAIGLDHIQRSEFLSLHELAAELDFEIDQPFILLTYHPVTLAEESAPETFKAILEVLDEFIEYQVIITYPNADDGGRQIIPLIEKYAAINPGRVFATKSLGQKRYTSAMKYASALVGNSSSAIIEAPAFGLPSVNVGQRQAGRLSGNSVVDCLASKDSIRVALRKVLKKEACAPGDTIASPYGDGDQYVSKKIIAVIKNADLATAKIFYDLD